MPIDDDDEREALARTGRRHPHGRISRETAELMAPSLSAAQRAALASLTGDPGPAPVRASAGRYDDDGDVPTEFAALYPPGTFGQQADRRVAAAERIAAAARVDLGEDELYRMLWPDSES